MKITSKIFLLLLCLYGQAEAKSGFGTGLVVGYLFGHSGNNHSIINHYGGGPSHDDRMYEEYKRNEALIKKGVADRRDLALRNDQIAKEFADEARRKYIEGFTLKLIPLSSRVIESATVENNSPLSGLVGMNRALIGESQEPKQFSNHRDEVKYEIALEGPQPISDFKVLSVNGKPAVFRDGRWIYTYQQVWGVNSISVEMQDVRHPSLSFTLDDSYVVSNPSSTVKESNRLSAEKALDKVMWSIIPTIISFMIFGLLILYALKNLRVLDSEKESRA